MAPAPTQTPSTAAMIGCGQARIALTRSPVMRVKSSRPFMSRVEQRADDVVHVAAGAEIAAVRAEHHRLDVVGVGKGTERVAQFGIGFEGDRVLALRPVQGDERDLAVDAPVEMLRLEILHGHGRLPLHCGCGRPDRQAAGSCPPLRATSKSDSNPSTQSSCAVAMAANSAAPFGVSRTTMARRSPAARLPRHQPFRHQPVDDAGDVAVRHHQEARQLGHGHAGLGARQSAP